MKKIIGRVLLKETNSGIPNLVVAAFHQDGPSVASERSLPASLDQLGERLGSVITDENGGFEIDTEHCEPAGGAARPNLILAVFAPEDAVNATHPTPAPPEQRLVHLSAVPRHHAGAIEAYVIRLVKAQLHRFDISATSLPLGHRDDDALLNHFVTSVGQVWANQARVNTALKPMLEQRVQRVDALRTTAKQKLANLSAVPTALRTHPLFVPAGAAIDQAQANAIAAGMARVSSYTKSISLRLTSDQLTTVGLAQGRAGIEGNADAQKLASVVNDSAGVDLVRRRSLSDACQLGSTPPTTPGPISIAPAATGGQTVALTLSPADGGALDGAKLEGEVLSRVLGQLQDLPVAGQDLPGRPNADILQAELDALRLKGGPADAVAFHDFQVLQIAFKSVWTQAFDGALKQKAEDLYNEYTRVYDEAGLEIPPFSAINDINDLKSFLREVERSGWVAGTGTTRRSAPAAQVTQLSSGGISIPAPTGVRGGAPQPAPTVSVPIPAGVLSVAPEVASVWSLLSRDQQQLIVQQAAIATSSPSADERTRALQVILAVAAQPAGPGGRLVQLMYELGKAINEPYAFDVFAPNTYNFGVMLTYRQRWEPIAYQAGDLVATIPLAPGETRKYSHRRVVKQSRAEKEIEKSLSTRSEQSTETGRAEAEIINRASTATNFKLNTHGSFNIGVANIDATTDFGLDQKQDSQSTKKDFHEATMRAAEEYRLERSLEVDTTTSSETEDTTSGEISNPNNELTVTYLFYELQRRYRLSEHLHRARPVILVAQDVPAPHEIDEAWLIQYQWILSRVLLDDSLRPALDYLSSGLAGDEVGTEVLRARWEAQRSILTKLEAQVDAQIKMRDALRETLVETTQNEALANQFGMPLAVKVFTLGLAPDPGKIAADRLEAERKAAQTRLQYAEQALADMQKKLSDASTTFEQATRDYAAALQNQYSRHVAIDQLRVHVKQNILYYMQAIWDHEPPDQRFFRLYNKKVKIPTPGTGIVFPATSAKKLQVPYVKSKFSVSLGVSWGPTIDEIEVDMVEIADLDSPLGYKGNYIIFPLKRPTYLTTFMMHELVDDYFGVRDPDELGNYTVEELEDYIECLRQQPDVPQDVITQLQGVLEQRLSEDRPATDEIIVPTGQLFIEALPGAHALLEDYKLLHRVEDVRKAKADVRHAELENLRLAARLASGEHEDPDIEKRIVVDQGTSVVVSDT